MLRLVLVLILTGCSTFVRTPKFHAYVEHGFMESFAYTELYNPDGTVMQGSGKLTICNGYGGFVSSVLQDAAIVGSAALIGSGIGRSGDRTTVANDSNSSSNSVSNSKAISGSNSSATVNNPPPMKKW